MSRHHQVRLQAADTDRLIAIAAEYTAATNAWLARFDEASKQTREEARARLLAAIDPHEARHGTRTVDTANRLVQLQGTAHERRRQGMLSPVLLAVWSGPTDRSERIVRVG